MSASTSNPFTRRTALAGLGAGSLGLALFTRRGAAQESATDLASHPVVGTWLDAGGSISCFGPDGSITIVWSANFVDSAGNVVFQSPGLGVWEPADDLGVHFTAVAIYSEPAGTYKGTSTLDGYVTVSEDGQSFIDGWSHGSKFTDRDPNNVVISEFAGDANTPPVIARRIGVWNAPFPVASPTAGTPEP